MSVETVESNVVVAGEGVAENTEANTPVVNETAQVEGNIPGELFAQVWNTSNSRQEALDTFKAKGYTLKYGSLGARVKSFRKAGVTMKEMPRASTVGRKGKKLDVSKLNAAVAAVLQPAADAAKVAAAAGEANPAS